MPDNILKFEFQTIPNKELESITQSVYSNFGGVREFLTSEMISLKELDIRNALIELGWTPPKEDPNAS